MMRKCPRCNLPMASTTLHSEKVERCSECNGTFFDKGELGSIINLIQIYREVEFDEKDIQTLEDSERKPYTCPSDGFDMTRKDYLGAILDECRDCGGLWLDDGEIASLATTATHIQQNLKLYIRLGE